MTSDRVEQLIKQAQDDRDRGQFNEAIAACQAVLVLDPGFAPAYRVLGDVFQDRGQPEPARRAYARASQLQSGNPKNRGEKEEDIDEWVRQGDLACQKGEFEVAIAQYRRVIGRQPHRSQVRWRLGKVLARQGQLAEAIKLQQSVLDLKPDWARASEYFYLGHLCARQGQTEAAIDSYQTALQGQDAILFFAPEGAIVPHFAAQCVLARTLKELGHSVIFARCTGIFERCPVIDMHRLPYDLPSQTKANVCQYCTRSSAQMLAAYGLDSLDLSAFVTPDIRDHVRQALDNAPADLRQFEFEGIQFGKLCTTELALIAKRHSFEGIDNDMRRGWLSYIGSSLTSYLSVDRLCGTLPIQRVVYYDDYSLMIGARLAAVKHELSSFRIVHTSHVTVDRRRYTIMPSVARGGLIKQQQAWPDWQRLSLTQEQVKDVADDSIVRLGGGSVFVYSPSKTFGNLDLYNQLKLDQNKQLIVAYLSSVDEIISLQMSAEALGIFLDRSPQPFEDQIEWLEALTDYVEKSENLQLVIRVHPRIGQNKRETRVSEFLVQLQDKFARPFQHCRVVWPENQISSYDLGEITDVALVAWSSIGLELARLGVPVLAFDNSIEFFPDFVYRASTAEQYFQTLEKVLHRSTDIEQVRQAFLWYNLRALGTSINLQDIIPNRDFMELPEFQLTVEAKAIEELIVNEKHIVELSLERLKNMQHSEIALEEKLALQHQLRRMLHFLLTGEDNVEDYKLYLFAREKDDPEQFREKMLSRIDRPPMVRSILVLGKNVHYWYNQNLYSKYSPMCVRLAKICAQYLE